LGQIFELSFCRLRLALGLPKMPREEEDEEQHQAGSSKRRHHDDDEGTETSVSSLVFVRSCSVLKSICLLLCACAADGEGGEEEGGKKKKSKKEKVKLMADSGQTTVRS
jgi:hypothetical protein